MLVVLHSRTIVVPRLHYTNPTAKDAEFSARQERWCGARSQVSETERALLAESMPSDE